MIGLLPLHAALGGVTLAALRLRQRRIMAYASLGHPPKEFRSPF